MSARSSGGVVEAMVIVAMDVESVLFVCVAGDRSHRGVRAVGECKVVAASRVAIDEDRMVHGGELRKQPKKDWQFVGQTASLLSGRLLVPEGRRREFASCRVRAWNSRLCSISQGRHVPTADSFTL